MMNKLFFDSWDSLIRTFLIALMAYPVLIFMLRISGKRTLSQMNAFDFIVTVALGSSLATVLLNKDVALVDGALAFLMLIVMQFVITWLAVRVPKVKEVVNNRPTMLLYRGEVFKDVLKKERITIEEIYLAARKKGMSNLAEIGAVVLETTGELTVMKDMSVNSDPETLSDVVTHNKVE